MKKNYLRMSKNVASNVATHLFGANASPDVIEDVIVKVAELHPTIYQAAVAERGKGVLHSQMAKSVKRALAASNDGRSNSGLNAPCKTHQRLKFADATNVA